MINDMLVQYHAFIADLDVLLVNGLNSLYYSVLLQAASILPPCCSH